MFCFQCPLQSFNSCHMHILKKVFVTFGWKSDWNREKTHSQAFVHTLSYLGARWYKIKKLPSSLWLGWLYNVAEIETDFIKSKIPREGTRCLAVDSSEVISFQSFPPPPALVSGNLTRWYVFLLDLKVVFPTSDSDPNQEEYPDAAVWTPLHWNQIV